MGDVIKVSKDNSILKLLLACGLSIGFADPDAPENRLRADKLKVEDYTIFLDT